MSETVRVSTVSGIPAQVPPARLVAEPGAAGACRALEATVACDEAAFAALEADWRALEARVPTAEFFSTFDWSWTWWRHFGAPGGARPAVIAIRRAEWLIAVLPLAIVGAGPYRSAVLMGAGSGQYGDILFDETAAGRRELHEALWSALRRIGADTLQADNVRDDSGLADFLATRHARTGKAELSYEVATAGFADFEAYMAARPARLRKDLRRRRRRLAEEGPIAYEVIDDARAIAEGAAEATRLKRRWLAERGLFGRFLSQPAVDGWLAEVCGRAAEAGRLHFSVLKVSGQLAAVQVAFRSERRLVGYFAAFDVRHARHSVGKLHLEDHLRDVFGRGLVLDLLPPADGYKREWGARGTFARSYMVALTPFGRAVALVHNPRQRERLKALYLGLPGGLRAGLGAAGVAAVRRLGRALGRRARPSPIHLPKTEDPST